MKNGLALTLMLVVAMAVTGWAEDDDEGLTLDQVPAAVKATILKEAAGAKIGEIEKEIENGTLTYEATFVRDGKTVEIEVAPTGKLLCTEVELALGDVPAAVKATILKEANGAKIEEVEMATEGGKTFYEAEFEVGGKEVEIKVAPDGKLLGREIEDGDDDDDDDEDEENVSLDQVPAAVKATILKEAAGAKIKEIEKETKGGKTVYEAEFVVGGKEVEIEVAPDGKLLKREVDDD